jgi:hypothetical protein
LKAEIVERAKTAVAGKLVDRQIISSLLLKEIDTDSDMIS